MAIIFSIGIDAHAQQLFSNMDDKSKAHFHLEQLQKGTLVILLKGDKKKREKLQSVIDDGNSSPAQKKNAQKQYDASVTERRKFYLELNEALKTHYTFSDYRLLYDHDVEGLSGQSKVTFLNDSLQPDESIKIVENSPIYLLKEEYYEGVLSYVLYDAESKHIGYPAPTVKLAPVGPALLLRSMFEDSEYREASKIVTRFDQMLYSRLASLEKYMEKKGEKTDSDG